MAQALLRQGVQLLPQGLWCTGQARGFDQVRRNKARFLRVHKTIMAVVPSLMAYLWRRFVEPGYIASQCHNPSPLLPPSGVLDTIAQLLVVPGSLCHDVLQILSQEIARLDELKSRLSYLCQVCLL